MKSITIQVEEAIADAYQASDLEKQEKINTLIKLFLQPDFSQKSLSEVMEDIADKAQKRRLTPEILEDILNEGE